MLDLRVQAKQVFALRWCNGNKYVRIAKDLYLQFIPQRIALDALLSERESQTAERENRVNVSRFFADNCSGHGAGQPVVAVDDVVRGPVTDNGLRGYR